MKKINKKFNFINNHRRSINVLYVFIAIFAIFILANPRVFLNFDIYNSVFTAIPIIVVLTLPMVFVITSSEIDLSFGSILGMAGFAFSIITVKTQNPYIGFIACILVGVICGLINGILVTKLKLSSLVSTLGMSFFLRGLVMIITQGNAITMVELKSSIFSKLLTGRIIKFPVQMIWAIIITLLLWFLYNHFRFGAYIHFVGDNRNSAREMGINIDKTIIGAFCLVGVCAAIGSIFSVLINLNYWPTSGDGYLLVVLAAVFLGGTPTWGGVGTITGAFLGAIIIGFLDTGIIAAGLTGFYTKLIYGLIIIIAIISHRYGAERKRA